MEVNSSYPLVVDHCPIFDDGRTSYGDDKEHAKLKSIYSSSLFDNGIDRARQELKKRLQKERPSKLDQSALQTASTDHFWRQFRSFVIDSVNKDIREAIKHESKRFRLPFPQIRSKQDLHNWSQAVAFEAMCGVVLGKILARLEKDQSDFRESFHRVVERIKCSKAMEKGVETIKDVEKINNFLDAVVKARQADVLNGVGGGHRQDLLWKFISSKNKSTDGEGTAKDGMMADVRLLRNMVKILILAGTATISTATTWFIQLMATNSKGQTIKSNVEFHKFQKKICWQVAGMENWRNQYLLDGLSYLDACILEAIRMHPEAPKEHNQREEKNCKLTIDQPEKFIPERWLDGTECFVGIDECFEPLPSFFEDHERGSFTKKMVFVVVKCVAVAVFCRYEVRECAEGMKITVIDKKKMEEERKKLVEDEKDMKEAEKKKRDKLKNPEGEER